MEMDLHGLRHDLRSFQVKKKLAGSGWVTVLIFRNAADFHFQLSWGGEVM